MNLSSQRQGNRDVLENDLIGNEDTNEINTEEWGEDQEPGEPGAFNIRFKYEKKKLTEHMKFKWGSTLVYVCIALYVLFAIIECRYGEFTKVDQVWKHSIVFIPSIITLILGYYFGKESKE